MVVLSQCHSKGCQRIQETSQSSDPLDRVLVPDDSVDEDEKLAELTTWPNNQTRNDEECGHVAPLPVQD